MVDTSEKQSANPWVDSWMNMQTEFEKMQSAMAASVGNASPSFALPDTFSEAFSKPAAQAWDLYRQQVDDWIAAASNWSPSEGGGDDVDATSAEALRRMMDPTQFFGGGFDDVSKALRQLVEGPELADLGTLERQVLKASKEWADFQEAGTAYRTVMTKAWTRAFEKFSASMIESPSISADGSRAVLDHWLKIANQELILTQRSEEFLETQRRFLRAGIEYRIKQRELIEVWCEIYSIPTRTEVDDLHRTVYGLRRQLRSQEARLKALEDTLQNHSNEGVTS